MDCVSLFKFSNGLHEFVQNPAMDGRSLSEDQQWTAVVVQSPTMDCRSLSKVHQLKWTVRVCSKSNSGLFYFVRSAVIYLKQWTRLFFVRLALPFFCTRNNNGIEWNFFLS